MNHGLGGKIMTKFSPLRHKTCSFLTDDINAKKKAKDTKKCFIKQNLEFEGYTYYLAANLM